MYALGPVVLLERNEKDKDNFKAAVVWGFWFCFSVILVYLVLRKACM